NTNAPALEPRQPATDEWSSENHIATTQANQSSEFIRTDELASVGNQASVMREQWQEVLPVSGNLKGRAPFAEAAALPRIDDALAQFDVEQTAEAEAVPAAATRTRLPLRQERASAPRLAQKFVQTNFQIHLSENLERLLSDRAINSDALIKAHEALSPAKTKCRVRIFRIAPETPRPLEKPAIVS
ncbi:MAG TPA: hypothetical protein VGC89_21290, partial [Pyrinomonadaceae bacterium]